LHFAILKDQYENIRTLLKYGAKTNVQDANGNTPMHYAVLKQSLPMVRLLDEYNADARIKNDAELSCIDLTV
jgi:ankyrin repeat protein